MSTRRVHIPWNPQEEARLLSWMDKHRHLSWKQKAAVYQGYKQRTANSLRSKYWELRSGQKQSSRIRRGTMPQGCHTDALRGQTMTDAALFGYSSVSKDHATGSRSHRTRSTSSTSSTPTSISSSRSPQLSFQQQSRQVKQKTCRTFPPLRDLHRVDRLLLQSLRLPRLPVHSPWMA